ncbi:MAG: hypothetical protein IPJ87_04445 [Flavobacteriales bacterium]|jgi:hypothetical protein|nr:hypothetical protein [Flavobacteriales bacterium]
MRRLRHLMLMTALSLGLAGCYKDDIDLAELTNNPFDADYAGPAIFSLDTIYVEQVLGPPNFFRQVVQFKVNASLFLASASYQVEVHDLIEGTRTLVGQVPPGSHTLRFYRLEYQPGQGVCLEMRLTNNNAFGRPETICGTWP